MTIKTSSYHQTLMTDLQDSIEASAYLNAAAEDSPDAFEKALKNLAEARQIKVAPGVDLTEPTGEVWDAEQ